MTLPLKTLLLLGFVCSFIVVQISGNHTHYIELRDGSSVRGLLGADFESFLGIPYALPPLGHLRFAVRMSITTIFLLVVTIILCRFLMKLAGLRLKEMS